MKIRNPWAHGEWKGDWSDHSGKWTTRLRNMLKWSAKKDEGIFWMELSDFVDEFFSIYVCRDFSDEKVYSDLVIDGRWEGESAKGIPTARNPKANAKKCPQYGLTITKPCIATIMLRMKEKTGLFGAKLAGYLNLAANDGKLIKSLN